jgi:hypothetical protein
MAAIAGRIAFLLPGFASGCWIGCAGAARLVNAVDGGKPPLFSALERPIFYLV